MNVIFVEAHTEEINKSFFLCSVQQKSIQWSFKFTPFHLKKVTVTGEESVLLGFSYKKNKK